MKDVQICIGKALASLVLDEHDRLLLSFTDGSSLCFVDDGQTCCECRYMRTDDDLDGFVGAQFLSAQIKDAPGMPDDDGNVHEVQFLEIQTSKGCLTLSSHNEHNGCYSGFDVRAHYKEPNHG